MGLIDGLPVLKSFAASFHDVGDVTGYMRRIKTTRRDHSRQVAAGGLQDNTLFRISQDGKIWVMRCDNYLSPKFHAGKDIYNHLANEPIIEIFLWLIDDKRGVAILRPLVLIYQCRRVWRSLVEQQVSQRIWHQPGRK